MGVANFIYECAGLPIGAHFDKQPCALLSGILNERTKVEWRTKGIGNRAANAVAIHGYWRSLRCADKANRRILRRRFQRLRFQCLGFLVLEYRNLVLVRGLAWQARYALP